MRPASIARVVIALGIFALALNISNAFAQILPPLSPPFPAIAPTLNPSDPANNLNACSGSDCTLGKFTEPFEEPTITYTDSTGTHTVTTQQKCLVDADGVYRCKPAGATQVMLPDGNILYWDALEGTENVELSIVAEYGFVSENDQSRVLKLSPSGNTVVPSWTRPSPVDGGANPNGTAGTPLLPEGLLSTAGTQTNNEGALFCSDQVELPDGLIMAAGGTDYYTEPGVQGIPYGVAELEGLKNARLFDWRNLNWSQTGSMNWGRWYPSLVSLTNGNVFVASGVTKLLKPVYPQAPIQSGTNVSSRPRPSTGRPACGPTTAPMRNNRSRCFRECICCPTATCSMTRAARPSTRSGKRTMKRCGILSARTILQRSRGPISDTRDCRFSSIRWGLTT